MNTENTETKPAPKTYKARLRRVLAAHEAWRERKGYVNVGRSLDCREPGQTVAWGSSYQNRGGCFTVMWCDAEGEARFIAGSFEHVMNGLST